MKRYYQIVLILIYVFVANSCKEGIQTEKIEKPKNVILLIGDGMGVDQVSASFYFNPDETNFSRFPYTGFINTSSASHKITDSGAGGTALASGVKTTNGALGVDAESVSRETIVEIASKRKLSTGLVSTSSITHATPAAFYCHTKSRGNHEENAVVLLNSEVDFFAGGGIKWWTQREDNNNLFDEFEANGFVLDTTDLGSNELDENKKYGYLFAPDGMPAAHRGRGDFLPEATRRAIDYLSKDNEGFFLMIEGSQIDWAGHANDAEFMIAEMIDFDKTIGVALDFSEKDGNTLVVVTADHETGGMALSPKVIKDGDREYSDYNQPDLTFATGGHTCALIPVFAFGPGSGDFSGIYENTDIFHRIMKVTGWNE